MIALDTNILVRLLTRDDDKQAEKVRILFETHAENNDQFFVSDVVLAELAWTLERTYGFDFFSFLLPHPERFQFAEQIGWYEKAVMALNRLDLAWRRHWPVSRWAYTQIAFARKTR